MTDSSEIGRYGTLRLLKRREPQTTLAFFPVDDESVTFGRSKQCSIRLYYDCVSELHCTLQISEEHKAFLMVHGTNGLLVDGCHVVPARAPGSSSPTTTVPLTNGSEIEIYKKRFKFEYPPKEVRAALLATPRNASRRRSLRMSMIESAQVFTPRVDANTLPKTPRRWDLSRSRDLMALKSPIKIPSQDGGSEQEAMLLEGEETDALIVEEEKDIIVVEQVDDDGQEPSPTKPKFNRGRSVAFSIPASTPPPAPISNPQSVKVSQRIPQVVPTHRRRSLPSLHRAVVLRSAHRALQREQQRFEEQQEEDEVEAEITPERELGPSEVGANDPLDYEEQDDEDEDDETSESQQTVVQLARPARRVSAFRASLDAMRNIIPLPFNWKAPGEVPLPDVDDDIDDDDDDDEKENDDNTNNQVEDDSDSSEDDQEEPDIETPVRRNLGPFMTPQVHRPAQHIPVGVKPRASVDGEVFAHKPSGRAQRVRVVPAWKVNDIVIPEPEKPSPAQESKRQPISEEERKAINARRKSALQSPSHLPVPGPRTSELASAQGAGYTPGEDSDEDTGTMLEKMQQKLADVRRKSEARRASLGIGSRQPNAEFSLLASNTKRNAISGAGASENEGSSHTPGTGASLTPRFDGVREMFRQPVREPRTPSFAGFRTMFKENAQPDPKTPSFRGVRELFNRTQRTADPSTPLLNLGEIFDEDDEDDSVEPMNEEDGPKESEIDEFSSAPQGKFNDESETFASGPKTRRKGLGSASKLPSKEVVRVDVPSVVPEEQDENVDNTGAKPKARSPVRRGAKRSAKNAATGPTLSNGPPPGGRTGSRNAGKGKASDSEDVKGDTVVKRTGKTRKDVDSRTDDEEQIATSSKTHSGNGGRGKRNKPQTGKTEADPEQDEVKNATVKARSRKAKAVESSDCEEVVQPKPRRTRTTKGVHDSGGPAHDPDPAGRERTPHVKAEEEPTRVPVPKPQKTKRNAKKEVGEPDNRSPAERVDNVHETEAEATLAPPPPPAKSNRAGSKRKEAVKARTPEGTSDNEKENVVGRGQHGPSDKSARTRRGAGATGAAATVTAGGVSEGPTKRTRSRK